VLNRVRNVAGEVSLKLIVLDMIDDGGKDAVVRCMEFYRRLGFQDRPERIFIHCFR